MRGRDRCLTPINARIPIVATQGKTRLRGRGPRHEIWEAPEAVAITPNVDALLSRYATAQVRTSRRFCFHDCRRGGLRTGDIRRASADARE